MTPRSFPMTWAAFAIGLIVIGGAALDAGMPGAAVTEPGAASLDPHARRSGTQGPDVESPAAQASRGQSPDERFSTEQSPAEQSPAEQSPAEQSPAEQSAAEQSADEQSADEQSATGQSPTGQSPTGQSPGELVPGALAVRYGGDVAEARRTLGTKASAADFLRMRALGVDAVVIDIRIDAGSRDRGRGVTLEGDARVQAAANQARAAGLAVVLWPIVVASPSGPRFDDLPGLLDEARLRRERRLRVEAARRFGSERLIALDGSIGSVEEVKGHTPEVSRERLRSWREDLGEALAPRPGDAAAVEPDRFAVLLGADALANAAGGLSGIPDDWGLGVWIGGSGRIDGETVASAVARHALVCGPRLELLSIMYDGGDTEPLLDLARARDAHAAGAAIVIGTWRHGGGGALAGLTPEVWEELAR